MQPDIEPFAIWEPQADPLPIIVSVPHSGTDFPESIVDHLAPGIQAFPRDTDWFVDRLYSFVPQIGATLVKFKYSRYLIDLNRDPEGAQLYGDGRRETGLCPEVTFAGDPVYDGYSPDQEEIAKRLNRYYWPYYEQLRTMLTDRLREFGAVLLWDAHSIPRRVPSISDVAFPDLVLGSNQGSTAPAELLTTIEKALTIDPPGLQLVRDHPFRGGHLTRYFGAPRTGFFACQLEMSQDVYMSESECRYDEAKAQQVRSALSRALFAASEWLLAQSD